MVSSAKLHKSESNFKRKISLMNILNNTGPKTDGMGWDAMDGLDGWDGWDAIDGMNEWMGWDGLGWMD